MKAGILTFHCAYNYGAVLQCYAMQEWLKGNGIDAQVVNYRPCYLETRPPRLETGMFKPTRPVIMFRNIFRVYPARKRQYAAFCRFEEKYLCLTEECCDMQSVGNIVDSLDCIIVGSDQIWNTRYNGNDSVWYADFQRDASFRVIAYAASAGDPDCGTMRALDGFDAISVRERALAEVLTGQGCQSSVVLDPVLLVTPDVWEKWKEPVAGSPYILVYQGRSDADVMRIAGHLGKKYGAKVISVDNYMNSFSHGISHLEPGPDGFVSLVRNAVCVVTTSFHGAAMSIALQTPFYVVRLDDGADLRAEELLDRMGLPERMLAKDAVPDEVEIDFSRSMELLEAERIVSRDFLAKSLNL